MIAPLGRRYDKHRLIQASYVLGVANGVWLIGSRLLGIMPENGHPVVYPLILLQTLLWAAFAFLGSLMVVSFTADIVDEQELETGVRQEGVFYAVEAFSVKAVSGVGALLGGLILDFIEFPNGADPGAVPEDVLFELGVYAGPVLAVVWFLPLGLSFLLDFDRKRHAEIRAALARRYEEGDEPA